MKQTSLDAYYNLVNLPSKRYEVYLAIQEMGQASNLDIAEKLKWPINRVTPRTNELVKIGLVEEARRDTAPQTNRTVIFWRIA